MTNIRQWSKYTTHNTYVDANKVLWFKRLLDDTNNGVLEVFINNVFETHVLLSYIITRGLDSTPKMSSFLYIVCFVECHSCILTYSILFIMSLFLHCWKSRTRRVSVSVSVLDSRLIHHFYIYVSFSRYDKYSCMLFYFTMLTLNIHLYKVRLGNNLYTLFFKWALVNEIKRSICISEWITFFLKCMSRKAALPLRLHGVVKFS